MSPTYTTEEIVQGLDIDHDLRNGRIAAEVYFQHASTEVITAAIKATDALDQLAGALARNDK